jgi:hypothetical protein
LAGRVLVGVFQLLLASAGFCLIVAWFGVTLVRFYRLIEFDVQVDSNSPAWLGVAGAALFLLAWLWSLVTSLSIVRLSVHPFPSQAPVTPQPSQPEP